MNKKRLKKQIYDIWAEYEPYIRKLCKYKLNSMPDCIDDCVQDVFLDLSVALNEGKTINNPKAWLTTVTNNKIKDLYSKSKKEADLFVVLSSELEEPISTDEYFEVSDEQLLQIKDDVIKALKKDEQELLHYRYVLKKSVKEIAAELNTTENNIYQRLFRLKVKVKMQIQKQLCN